MAKEVVKMRVNTEKKSECNGCGIKWSNTKEMYDMMICGNLFTLCFDCVDKIFHKTLLANCKYNAKIKSKEDEQRIINYKNYKRG